MLKINNHLLEGPGVKVALVKGKNDGVFKKLDTLVYHYTVSGTLSSAVDTLSDPSVESCAHLVIDKDGSVVQLIPFNIRTWHAGKGAKWKTKVGMNQYSIGIEIVNWGRLTETNGIYRSAYSKIVDPTHVIKAVHRNEKVASYWETYTPEQINVAKEIGRLLVQTYGISEILGHEQIRVGQKFDPGPAFPLDTIKADLLNGDKDDDSEFTGLTTTAVNIRLNADASSPIICTLSKDSKVPVTREVDGFYEVVFTGYVKKDYVIRKD